MKKKKVLFVEDEPMLRKLYQTTFKGEKEYEVYGAESAEEAIDILEKEHLMVICIDLHLPGMNGVELCRRIRKQNPIALIYAITGYASHFELNDCRGAGFDDYFIKPIPVNTLRELMNDSFVRINRWRRRKSTAQG